MDTYTHSIPSQGGSITPNAVPACVSVDAKCLHDCNELPLPEIDLLWPLLLSMLDVAAG